MILIAQDRNWSTNHDQLLRAPNKQKKKNTQQIMAKNNHKFLTSNRQKQRPFFNLPFQSENCAINEKKSFRFFLFRK